MVEIVKEVEERNLLSSLEARSMNVVKYLSKARNIALQITTRTWIREKLDTYSRGEIGLPELADLAAHRLADSMKRSEEVARICLPAGLSALTTI